MTITKLIRILKYAVKKMLKKVNTILVFGIVSLCYNINELRIYIILKLTILKYLFLEGCQSIYKECMQQLQDMDVESYLETQ